MNKWKEIEERRGNCHRLRRKKTRMNRRLDVNQQERQEAEVEYRDAKKSEGKHPYFKQKTLGRAI